MGTKLISHKYILLFILLIAAAVLWPTINNDVLLWDDESYITNNELIKELSTGQISNTFSTVQVNGTYAPLSIVSWSLDYFITELNPSTFHWHNLILHLLNIVLVYLIIQGLFKDKLVTFITTMLFAIHPMHVESIAWISGRKDLLYSLYFLLAILSYQQFSKSETRKLFWLTVCFIMACLSMFAKGMAITLPAVLILIDYLDQRLDRKRMLQKIPFVIVSISFLAVGMLAQKEGQALDLNTQSVGSGFLIAASGLTNYLYQLVVP